VEDGKGKGGTKVQNMLKDPILGHDYDNDNDSDNTDDNNDRDDLNL
jgi:hypothetical protein